MEQVFHLWHTNGKIEAKVESILRSGRIKGKSSN